MGRLGHIIRAYYLKSRYYWQGKCSTEHVICGPKDEREIERDVIICGERERERF